MQRGLHIKSLLRQFGECSRSNLRLSNFRWSTSTTTHNNDAISDDQSDLQNIFVPKYKPKDLNESIVKRRARLTWQSRKRGIAENCLLFSTFADQHLSGFTEEQLDMYDNLLNTADNDWEMYYWMTKAKPVPKQFDNEIMMMLQRHCQNEEKAERFEQPALKYEPVQQ